MFVHVKVIEYDGVRGLINSLITVLVLLFVQCKLYPGALPKVYVVGKIHSHVSIHCSKLLV